MKDFLLDEYSRQGEELLEKTRLIFLKYDDLGLLENAMQKLPQNMKTEGGVKIVFIGQYSAGKSSIIKMLSGIDTEIGAGIKTKEAHTYTWNDLEIIDTPGIHTELRPDHDEKTYYEIDHAALLIFVITNEGFDDRIGHHFRKLAIEQNRAKNMVLVVNKMDRTSMGNVPEQQQIIADDLNKVIAPYNSEDLYLSFLDTDSYFNLENADDNEEYEYYLTQSGREKFVANLNNFVKSRGLLSKVQAPLETLKSVVVAVTGESTEQMRDADIDAIEEILHRRQAALIEGKKHIEVVIGELAENCAASIINEGEQAAGKIAPGTTEEEAKNVINAAQANADRYVADCMADIASSMEEIFEEIAGNIADIDKSDFVRIVSTNIENHALEISGEKGNILDHLPAENFLKPALEGALMKPGAARLLSFNIPGAGDINAAGMVKEVGHFFGVKFKPWGAVNLVNGAAKVLGYIGIAITAYQILKKFFGEDEDKKMRDIAKAQNEVRAEFSRGANEVKCSIITASLAKVEEIITPDIAEADEKFNDFVAKKDRIKELNRELSSILKDINNLMERVQEMKA